MRTQISFLSSSHAIFIYYLPQQLSTRVAKKGPSQIRTGVAGNLLTKVKIRSDNHYLEDISGGRQEQVHCTHTLMDQMVILMTNRNSVLQYRQDYLLALQQIHWILQVGRDCCSTSHRHRLIRSATPTIASNITTFELIWRLHTDEIARPKYMVLPLSSV